LLWRAVDEHGAELDILLQKRRDKAAAKRFFKRVRVQLKPEAALGNTLAAIVTFLLYGELQWFRHFPHI
jgi:hypothetical protein